MAELYFDLRAIARHWVVSKPLIDSGVDRYIQTEPNGPFYSVQIKHAGQHVRRKGAIVGLRKGSGVGVRSNKQRTYKPGEFDYWGIVADGEVYLVPFQILAAYTSAVNIKNPEFDRFKI